MPTKLVKQDWFWVAGFFLLFFLLVPLMFWQWSEYRKHGSEDEVRTIAQAVIAANTEAIQSAGDVLDQQVTSTTDKVQRYTTANGALINICQAIKPSIEKQDTHYSNRDWNCAFYIQKFGKTFKEDSSVIESLSDWELESIKGVSSKLENFDISSQGTGSYSVYYKVKSDPLVVFYFSIETDQPDYTGY